MMKKEVKENERKGTTRNIDSISIILIMLITIIILIVVGIIFYLNINKDTSKTVEASVKYVGTDYVIVGNDNDEYMLELDDEYNEGDKLSLVLDDIDESSTPKKAIVKKVDVLTRSVSFTIKNDLSDDVEDTANDTSNEGTTKDDNSVINDNDDSSSVTKSVVGAEEDVIAYFNQVNSEFDNSSSISQGLKQNFVTVVDFLFYGGKIKGKAFSELTTSAKLKVLKVALSIDKKIDSKFPGYKNELSDKYKNVKSKVVSKYLDITSDICSNNEDTCDTAKEGLSDMKKSFSLTWSFIKDIAGTSKSKLAAWYKVWKNS